jgi:hypothetical protein
MDTGDLSEETYRAIMIEAERFNHDLTLQFGLLSYDCVDEDDFIHKATELVSKMQQYESVDLDDVFFGEPPNLNDLHTTLIKILGNIIEIKEITAEKRTDD